MRKMQDYPSQGNGEGYLREQKAQATTGMNLSIVHGISNHEQRE
jgi:hypothetical protein